MAAGEAQGNSGSRWQPLGWLWLLALLVMPASAEQLNLGLMPSSTELRDRMLAVISQFHLRYPEHRINVVLSDAELVKGATDSASLNRVLGNVDLFIWYGGEPTFKLARLGELDDLSAIWQQQQLQLLFPAALGPAISLDGQIYALPLSFYTWGLLYRPQLLLDHGVRPPATFEQLLDVCHQLSAKGVVPVLLGSRHPWTLAGWFDYLSLRSQGLDFHRQLLAGQIPFTDRRVKAVFGYWQQLRDARCFNDRPEWLQWDEVLPLLGRGEGAMTLIGTFALASLPTERLNEYALLPFPQIDPAIAAAEVAPTDVLLVRAGRAVRPGVQAFIGFMASAEVQGQLNAALGMLPANNSASHDSHPVARTAAATLNRAVGVIQFFDRDMGAELAALAMDTMARYWRHPAQLNELLAELERQRQRLQSY